MTDKTLVDELFEYYANQLGESVETIIKKMAIRTLAQQQAQVEVFDTIDLCELCWETDGTSRQMTTDDELLEHLELKFTSQYLNDRERSVRRQIEYVGVESLLPDDLEFIEKLEKQQAEYIEHRKKMEGELK